ncbi:MAG TPA: SMC-Scp complex subunit ScpB [Kutzneria sp.]|nr:SMC-Scp complex subunit ScpB [Kutzneria sp.]
MTEPEDDSGEQQFEGPAGGGAAKPAPAEVEPPEADEPETAEQPETDEPVEVAEPEVEDASAEPEPEAEDSGSADGEAVDVAAVMGTILDEAAAYQAETPDDESGDEVLVGSGLPDLEDEATLHAALESLLLVVDSPAEDELLASTLEQPVKRIRQAMEALSARYTESGSGIDLRRVGDGWRMHTRDTYAPYVEKLLLDGQRAKLTRAALETLAVIAYRQPVTRSRVAAVRGVNVDGVIRTLVTRGLIEETGNDPDTGGILYRTTELFLERLGLSSLKDLPPIAPLLPEVDAIDDVG